MAATSKRCIPRVKVIVQSRCCRRCGAVATKKQRDRDRPALHTAKSEIEVHQRSQRGIWGAASVVAFFPIHYRKPEIVVSIAVM
jgi:hypothetical protein